MKHPVKSSYPHMTDFIYIEKNYKNEENPRDVVIPPRNILTNPIKRGQSGKQVYFGGKVPYMEDDFDRPKKLAALERSASHALMQDKPFSQRVKKRDTFNTHRAVFGEDVPIPHRQRKPPMGPLMEHDKPFKPSHPPRLGYNKTIARFPPYKEDPKKPITRKMKVEGEDEKPKFRPSHNYKTRPTPSIATNMRNLRTSFSTVFRR